MDILTREPYRDDQPAMVRRISWAAIFAGLIIVLIVQLSLSLLGIGIGASTIDPLIDETPTASSFSVGAGIWWIVTTMIALLLGGWVAGRLAGMPLRTDGLLHGLITWGAATLVTMYLLTTTAGSLLGGTFGLVGNALAATGQGLSGFAPSITNAVTGQMEQSDVTWKDIKQEAQILLQQTGKEELQAENLSNEAEAVAANAKVSAQDAASKPKQTDEELLTILDQVMRKGKDVFSEVDRKAVVNVLVARTNMSQQEAEQTVQRWKDTYEKAVIKYDEFKGQAQEKARIAADATAETISQASLWTFISMLFGAAAAAIGGFMGTPRDIIAPVSSPNRN
ncbi:TIGR04086 family membrane protein [Candidatus Nitrospira salsa]